MRSFIVLGLVAASLAVTGDASAATITVTSTADTPPDGCSTAPCTLREAIDKANATPLVLDVIVLATNATYTLAAATGGALVVNSPIKIKAKGSTIEGGAGWAHRLFDVTANGDLTIDSARLTKGNVPAAAGNGGAIGSLGRLELVDALLEGNVAEASGGAIFSDAGATLVVTDSILRQNVAQTGAAGAIDVDGPFSISGSTFFDNHATANFGGAMTMETTSPDTGSIVNTEFDQNSAARDGGAIRSSASAPVSIAGAIFTENEAKGSVGLSGDGGAIYNSGTDLVITRTTIDDNTAFQRGGGIFNVGVLEFSANTVSNNGASGTTATLASGGGIFDAGTMSLTNSTVSGNTAEDHAGGLSTTDTSTITNSTITNNTANFESTDEDGSAGGVASSGLGVPVTGSIIFGNADDLPGFEQTDCNGVSTLGGNVFASGGNCPTGAPGDSTVDPNLAPLAPNGGPTQTHAVPVGSSALDLNDVDTACGESDQRGAPRPTGEDCDSGGYELVLCKQVLVNVVGTEGKDALTGTAAADGILGLGGSDQISSGDGEDAVCAGGGNDRVKGGGGKDTLLGEAGNDRLNGGGARDRCIGGPGTDVFVSCERSSG